MPYIRKKQCAVNIIEKNVGVRNVEEAEYANTTKEKILVWIVVVVQLANIIN